MTNSRQYATEYRRRPEAKAYRQRWLRQRRDDEKLLRLTARASGQPRKKFEKRQFKV